MAQFHALPQGHAVWAVSFWIGPGYPYELWWYELDPAAADTVINGIPYERMSDGAIRDNLAGQVYFVPGGSEQEHLLYDFDVLPGDTIVYPPGVVLGDTLHVIAVDTIELAGIPRKQIAVSLTEQWFSGECYWIQGIGSIGGPFNICQGPSVSGTSWLTCMTEDGIFQFGGTGGEPGDCSIYYGIRTDQKKGARWSLYPNPGTTELNLEGSGTGRMDLLVAGPQGRLIGKWSFSSGLLRLNVQGWASGLYFLSLTDEKGVRRSLKWTKQSEE
jgi:hypothetical protein